MGPKIQTQGRRRQTLLFSVSMALAMTALALLSVPQHKVTQPHVAVDATTNLSQVATHRSVVTVWQISSSLTDSTDACIGTALPSDRGVVIAWIRIPIVTDDCLVAIRHNVDATVLDPNTQVSALLPHQLMPMWDSGETTAPITIIVNAQRAVNARWADATASTLPQLLGQLKVGSSLAEKSGIDAMASQSSDSSSLELEIIFLVAGLTLIMALLGIALLRNRIALAGVETLAVICLALIALERWRLGRSPLAFAVAVLGAAAVVVANFARSPRPVPESPQSHEEARSTGSTSSVLDGHDTSSQVTTSSAPTERVGAQTLATVAAATLAPVGVFSGGRPTLCLEPELNPTLLKDHQLRATWPEVQVIGKLPGGANSPIKFDRAVHVADTACDGASFNGLEVRAAAVRGLWHRTDGVPRQDAFSFGASSDGRFVVLAAADGVSAAVRSEIGADAAAVQGVNLLITTLDGGRGIEELDASVIMSNLAPQIRARAASRLGHDCQNFDDSMIATTLVLAVIDTEVDADGRHSAWCAWIGNSTPHVLYDGQFTCLARTTDSPIEDNSVFSMPSQPHAVQACRTALPRATALVLVSDGVTEALGKTAPGDVDHYLAQAWADAPGPLEMARVLGFARKGCLDDRVACGVWVS